MLSAAGPLQREAAPKGERLLSISITPPELDGSRETWEAYEAALDRGLWMGVDVPGALTFRWNAIEVKERSRAPRYEAENLVRWIELLRKRNLPAVITIAPFETLQSRIPKDLANVPYDHPRVLERLTSFVDWVYETTEGIDTVAIVFGDEFDLHVGFAAATERERWTQLDGMVARVKSHVRTLPRWSEAPFALEATYDGLVGPHRKQLQRLNRHADVIGVSYYPMGERVAEDPEVIGEHFDVLFGYYPGEKVHFYSAGYPSSARIGGSLDRQRRFVAEMFAEWDGHRDRIGLVNFTSLYDVRSSEPTNLTPVTFSAGQGTAASEEFTRSLGLLGRDVGDIKPAYYELKRQARARGWQER